MLTCLALALRARLLTKHINHPRVCDRADGQPDNAGNALREPVVAATVTQLTDEVRSSAISPCFASSLLFPPRLLKLVNVPHSRG